MTIEPKCFPTDFRTSDSWVEDKGPHYCELCGYDVVTRTSAGELRPIAFDAKYFARLPQRRWHPDCAARDERIKVAQRGIDQIVHDVFA
jgi:hypothetical protein